MTRKCRNYWSIRVIPEFFIYAHCTYIHPEKVIY
jgi:hypothetical protein